MKSLDMKNQVFTFRTATRVSTVSFTIRLILVTLFVYSATGKLFAFDKFRAQMLLQAVPVWSVDALVWFIPISELLVAIFLLTERWYYYAMVCAAVLMTVFTGYIGLILSGVFDQVPCSCGGVLQAMGWRSHFAFNLFFLLLSCLGIYTFNRERSVVGKE